MENMNLAQLISEKEQRAPLYLPLPEYLEKPENEEPEQQDEERGVWIYDPKEDDKDPFVIYQC